jgi:hypothetical protein
MSVKDFRQLAVWEKAHRLTLAVYQATGTFPKDELYGLTSQVGTPLLLSRQISLKDVGEVAMVSWLVFFR